MLPARMLRALPENLDLRVAALAEPAAVAWHAVAQAGDLRGKRILVVGSGPIGALAVAVAKRAGAQEVVAVDLHPRPREIASTVGATRTLAANDTDAVDAVGADVVIESSGNHRGLASAIRGATRGGTVVMVGLLPNGDQPVPIAHAITRELRLVGSFRFNDEIDEVIAALAAAADTNFRDDLTPLQACATELLGTAGPLHDTVLLAPSSSWGPARTSRPARP